MTTTKATAAPHCRVCNTDHWQRDGCFRQSHKLASFLADDPIAAVVETMSVRDSPLLLEALERLAVVEAQIVELRKELADVTRPVTQPVTPVTEVTGVMHNKITSSPERLAYLREYAKKRRAEAKA